MNKKARYKAALIGCGRVGSTLEDDKLREHPCTHAGAITSCHKIELVAGCDTNSERLEAFGKRWNIKRLYINHRDVLEKEKPDIVSIATWSHTHHEIVLNAVKAGVKGILCEKPIALSLGDASEMVKACKEAGTALLINHERRWDKTYKKVREMVQSGDIGELRTIVGNILTGGLPNDIKKGNIKTLGGGPLLHDGTHLFDIMRFIAGDIMWVSGFVSRQNKEIPIDDRTMAKMMFEKDVYAFVEAGGIRNYFNFELDIQGTEGRIVIGNGSLQLWKSAPSIRYSGFRDLVAKDFPMISERKSPYLEGVEDLINIIEGKDNNISSGEEGMKALEVIMAIYESARLEGKRVYLPLRTDHNPLEIMIEKNII